MTQLQDDSALIVIRIENDSRLTSDVTEDFIRVNLSDYHKSVTLLDRLYNSKTPVVIRDLTQVTAILDRNGIKYERIMEGKRYAFGSPANDPEEEDE